MVHKEGIKSCGHVAKSMLDSNIYDDCDHPYCIFRFGIILSEVCTREEPYSAELGYLEPEQVITLVIDKDSPEAVEPKKVLQHTEDSFNLLGTNLA